MAMRLLLLMLLQCAVGVLPAQADVFRPAYLHLRQLDAETWTVTWKVPAPDARTALPVQPAFPEGTQVLGTGGDGFTEGAVLQHWRIRIDGGLAGRPIGFTGLAVAGIDVLVRAERADGSEQVVRILPSEPTFTLRPNPGPLEVARTYTALGIEHILLGVDHLLFVLALVMIVRGRRELLVTVTAFTVAHSITLALATLGLIHVPGPPVEAVIALSIVFVATEILRLQRGHTGLAARQPWVVAFGFGLLHGLGFAGALAEVGLPQDAIPLALLFFNVGVEIGQVLFIAAVLVLAAAVVRLARHRPDPRWAVTAPAYVIGIVASYWVIERTLVLL